MCGGGGLFLPIGLPPQPGAIVKDLLHPAKEHVEHCLLDVLVAVDGGGQRLRQHLKRVVLLAPRESLDLGHVLGGEERGHLLGEDNDVVGEEDRAEGPAGVASPLGGKAAVVTDYLNPVPRLCVYACVGL